MRSKDLLAYLKEISVALLVIPKQVRDDKKTRTDPSCHAELDSASGLLSLLSADTPFIPVHRTGFSGAVLIKNGEVTLWDL